jgi:hypothetical protein
MTRVSAKATEVPTGTDDVQHYLCQTIVTTIKEVTSFCLLASFSLPELRQSGRGEGGEGARKGPDGIEASIGQ